MKSKWIFVLLSNLFFVLTFVVGIPFRFSVKDVSLFSHRYQITTPQHTLAKMIGMSFSANIQCENEKRCITPKERKNFLANIPIVFEECEQNENSLLCDNPKIQFTTQTSTLISVGFVK